MEKTFFRKREEFFSPSARGTLTFLGLASEVEAGALFGGAWILASVTVAEFGSTPQKEALSSLRDEIALSSVMSRTASPSSLAGGNGIKPRADCDIHFLASSVDRLASVLVSQKLIDIVSRPPQSITW